MKKIFIVTLLAVLVAGFAIGWVVRGNGRETPPQASQTQGIGNKAQHSAARDLVGYQLPDGWQEASCDDKPDAVYILPQQVALDCAADPAAPISLGVDLQGTDDCGQLDDRQNVRQHVCKSLDIDGRKSLKASTTASDNSTVAAYYVNSDKGVVKLEYRYQGQPKYLEDYDRIAESITVK